jgi:hypothetical protein
MSVQLADLQLLSEDVRQKSPDGIPKLRTRVRFPSPALVCMRRSGRIGTDAYDCGPSYPAAGVAVGEPISAFALSMTL